MGKFDGILLITDLDGTLLQANKSVSQRNRDAIRRFKENGGAFTFVTGRGPVGTTPVLEQVLPNAPIGCLNGGGIFDVERDEYLWKRAIDNSVLKLVNEVYNRFPEIGIELFGFYDVCFVRENAATEKHKTDERLNGTVCDLGDPPKEFAKVLFAAKSKQISILEKMLREHPLTETFDFMRSDEEYFEILPKGSCKGDLLVELSRLLHIPISRTVSVGDNDNDASMLEAAGLGIAVKNASARAKAFADMITVSNEEHAIAKIIDDIESGIIELI